MLLCCCVVVETQNLASLRRLQCKVVGFLSFKTQPNLITKQIFKKYLNVSGRIQFVKLF